MNKTKRYLAYNDSVRVVAIDATEMVQTLRDIHNLSNLATAALGRVAIVSAMIASTLKNNDEDYEIYNSNQDEVVHIDQHISLWIVKPI